MASNKIGTRGNPSSLLNPGVSDPEQLLKEARRNLISTSSEKFKQPAALEIPEYASIPVPPLNPHSEKGREELDLLFTPSQIDNFRVFTNPLLSEKVKLEALQTGTSSLVSANTPVAKTIPLSQSNPGSLSPSSQQSSTFQSNTNPRMAQNRMAAMVAARYAPLVFP